MSSDDALSRLLTETRPVVLVVDMQADFCAEDGYVAALGKDTAPCRAIVPRLTRFLGSARHADLPVLWAYANYDDALVPPSMLRKKRETGLTRDCCLPGTEGYEPFGVAPDTGEPVFVKHCYSAFTNDDFARHLEERSIETLIFTGVQTNVCIDSTLRDAHNRGYHVVVVEDCVASHTPPLHDATLANVRFLLGHVASADAVEHAWAAASTKGYAEFG